MDQDSISPSAIPRPADRTTADDIGGIHPPRSATGQVRIRPVVPGDTDGLRALHTAASNQSLYLRFFGYSRTAVEEYLTVLSRPASRTHQALTAQIGSRLVGVAAFERLTGDTAEVALLVADDYHERGIGTLLMEHSRRRRATTVSIASRPTCSARTTSRCAWCVISAGRHRCGSTTASAG